MKAYLILTGLVFALIALSHVLRLFQEGKAPLHNPWFIVTSLISLAMSVWAWRLLRTTTR